MNDAQKQWFRERIDAIHTRVTAYDVLRMHSVDLSQASEDREEQFSCPFHGEDKKPSARVYPARDNNPSHAWCFVCQEPGWDVIGLWRKFNNLSFGQALNRLEREFNLPTLEAPRGISEPSKVDENLAAFKRTYLHCESRLLSCKSVYRKQEDMRGYLNAGSILDRTKFKVDNNLWTPERGVSVLLALFERIRIKTKTCLDG